MYKKELETDFKALFGLRRVEFKSPAAGLEQDVLYINLTDESVHIRQGQERALVYGSVSIIGTDKKNPAGYLHKQIAKIKPDLHKKISFAARESPVSMALYDGKLVCYAVEFVYRYENEYNPPRGWIENVVILVNKIKGAFK